MPDSCVILPDQPAAGETAAFLPSSGALPLAIVLDQRAVLLFGWVSAPPSERAIVRFNHSRANQQLLDRRRRPNLEAIRSSGVPTSDPRGKPNPVSADRAGSRQAPEPDQKPAPTNAAEPPLVAATAIAA